MKWFVEYVESPFLAFYKLGFVKKVNVSKKSELADNFQCKCNAFNSSKICETIMGWAENPVVEI